MANVNIPTKVTGDPFAATDLNTIVTYLNRATIFRALISQSGSSAPTLLILENTTGLTFTPTRLGAGDYLLSPSSDIIPNKCLFFVGKSILTAGKFVDYQVVAQYLEISVTTDGSTGVDGLLQKVAVELTIYP